MLCLSLAASFSLFSLFASPNPSRSSVFPSLFPILRSYVSAFTK